MGIRVGGSEVVQAMRRVADALEGQRETLQRLDQASGDGDLGITAGKIAAALRTYAAVEPGEDLGQYIGAAGLAVNKAASSTLGTLLATALLRAGKEAKGLAELEAQNLAAMLSAADQGIQERGKARVGDKTIVDALHPAAEAFQAALAAGKGPAEAGAALLAAAEAGRDAVTPLRSKIGRASWQGERTEGQVDPGCEALVMIMRAVIPFVHY